METSYSPNFLFFFSNLEVYGRAAIQTPFINNFRFDLRRSFETCIFTQMVAAISIALSKNSYGFINNSHISICFVYFRTY